ncbi:MAG: hypothetical protein WC242_02230 [Candidatus Paceibacterota bacterium]|jgi:hypothetical protein
MPEVTARVYLETEKVTGSREFEVRPNKGKTYHGEILCYETAKLSYIDWPLNREIPEEMKPLIVSASIKKDFLCEFTQREIGVYEDLQQFGDCRATLDIEYAGRTDNRYLVYELEARGTDPENLRKLYEAIRGGTIHPAVHYDGSPNSKSRAELEAELEELRKFKKAWSHPTQVSLDHILQSLTENIRLPIREKEVIVSLINKLFGQQITVVLNSDTPTSG